MIPFLFLLCFAALSGIVGATLCGRLPFNGWPRIIAGIAISAALFAASLVLQFWLLRFFGDTRSVEELTRTGMILVGVCAIFWGPAFGLAYAALPTPKDQE